LFHLLAITLDGKAGHGKSLRILFGLVTCSLDLFEKKMKAATKLIYIKREGLSCFVIEELLLLDDELH